MESIGEGKAPILGQVLREVGYADNTADNPLLVTSTKSFQDAINPVVKKMEAHRNKILDELENKDLSEERHSDLVRSFDTMTKNVQLLSGKETERAGVTINVVKYDRDNDSPQIPS
ncbi:hypothetical protein KAU11_08325 [Candidatus Babeliales bacterium]|nr:hypothetical protein [Candidatus Babeliales bacterium]